MTEHDAPDPIQTAQNLTEALRGMAGQLTALNDRLKRTRHVVLGLVVSLVLDFALTAGVATVAVQAHHADSNAASAQSIAHATAANSTALCLSSNHARAQQVELWDYLLSLGSPPKTGHQRKVITEFKAHLLVIFAPRNCSHVSPGNP